MPDRSSSKKTVHRDVLNALVVMDEHGLVRIGGLSNVVRLVCCLKSSGFESVFIHGGGYAQVVREELERKNCESKVTVWDSAEPPEEFFRRSGSGSVEKEKSFYLGVSTSLVMDPVFLKELLEKHRRGETSSCFQMDSALWIDVLKDDGAGIDINGIEDLDRLSAKEFSGTFVLCEAEEGKKEQAGRTADTSLRNCRKKAEKSLLLSCRKPMDIDGLVCSLIGRPLSRLVSGLLLKFPVKPNHVTAASLVFGLVGALIAAMGNYLPMVIGAALVFFSWLLDNCDGEIARVKYTGSRFGAWFDIYADFITNVAFIGGMSVGLFRSGHGWVMLVLGGYAIVAQSIYNGVVFRYIHRLGIPDEFLFEWWFDRPKDSEAGCAEQGKTDAKEDSKPSIIAVSFSYIKYLGRRDFFIFAYLVAALIGILHWALWATAVGSTYSLALTIVHLIKTKGDPVGQ